MAVAVGSGGEAETSCKCALNGNSAQELHILCTLRKEEARWGGLSAPETENCCRSATPQQESEERSNDYIVATLQGSEGRLNPGSSTVGSATPCQTVAVYSREAVAPQLSWDADRAWYVM